MAQREKFTGLSSYSSDTLLLFQPGEEQTWADFEKLHLGASSGLFCMTPKGSLWFEACVSTTLTWPVGFQQMAVGDLRQKIGQKGL